MPQRHLGLQHPELVRHVGLGLLAHLLPRPLEGAVDLLRYVHFGGLWSHQLILIGIWYCC